MAKAIIIAVLMLSCLDSISQQVILSNPRRNQFYMRVVNPFELMVEGYSCKSIVLSTDNGTIEKNSCDYNFIPAKLGEATIRIKIKKGNIVKTIKVMKVNVDSFPSPVAYIGGLYGYTADKGVMATLPGLSAHTGLPNGPDIAYEVMHFTVTILDNDRTIFSSQHNNALFNAATKEAFKNIQAGYTVLFSNITCKGPEGHMEKIKPITLDIL